VAKTHPKRALAKERTRIALIDAGRKVFAEKGYHGAGTLEIVTRACVSRGALQHHFPRKKDLFLAVIGEVQRDWVRTLQSDADPALDGTWHGLFARLGDYLNSALSPEVRRIVLLDGPAVLDWSEWRDLGQRSGMVAMERALGDAMAQGVIEQQPLRPLAHLVLALFHEAALIVAHSDNAEGARAEVARALMSILVPSQRAEPA
jgi:AcrR family transcriptional regulator